MASSCKIAPRIPPQRTTIGAWIPKYTANVPAKQNTMASDAVWTAASHKMTHAAITRPMAVAFTPFNVALNAVNLRN
eukprot:scaffold212_cov72-Cylindrotheca_fusiformis.AAC.2